MSLKSFTSVIEAFHAVTSKYDFTNAVYAGAGKPITGIVCNEHGEFQQYPAELRKELGAHCPICNAVRQRETKSKDNFKVAHKAKLELGRAKWTAWLTANPNFTSDPASYTGMDAPVLVTCQKHSHSYQTRPATLVKQGSGCKFCGLEVTRRATSDTPEGRLRKVMAKHNGKYTYPAPLLSSNGHVEIICPQHGSFVQDIHNHITGSGCPKCSHRISKEEIRIAEWLRAEGAVVEIQDKTIIAPAELDIWLPEYSAAIEFNGAHWHAADNDRRHTARTKFEACKAKGIRLISIFDFEWQRAEFAILAILKAMLGKQQMLGARKLCIKPILPAQARELFAKWHVSGFVGGELHLGLFHDTLLVGAATFGKSRFAANKFELLRYATTCHVPGALSRVVKAAHVSLGFDELTSYCDMRYGTGKSYEGAGFEYAGITPADYWWFKGLQFKTRYQTQKHKLANDPEFGAFFDSDLRETDICQAAGWRQIFGVGHSKWIWRSDKN